MKLTSVTCPQSAVPEARGHKVHNKRVPLLQPGDDQQRRGRRGYREGERQRGEYRLDADEQKLGPKLAVQRDVGGPGSVVPRHGE